MKDFLPGIRYAIAFGGVQMSTPPSTIEPDPPEVAEASRRYRDGERQVTRLRPYAGAPDVVTKRSWRITWDSLQGAELGHLNACIAARGLDDGALNFCPWTYDCESFWIAEGATFGGYLQRRNWAAVYASGPGPSPDPATEFKPLLYVLTAGVWTEDTTLSLGSPTAAYRTPWTTSTPRTGATGGEQAVIFYVPVYRFFLDANQQSLAPFSTEGATIKGGE